MNKKVKGIFFVYTRRSADKSGKKETNEDTVIMETKIIKTNKTMIFTQNNLFFCVKKNLEV